MDSPTAPYEVHCPRCEVSFPIETRKCMHCGGPTGLSESSVTVEAWLGADGETDDEYSDPIRLMPDRAEREFETSDEPSSIGRTLIRSLGGFVWIVVLIAFTLARNCGGE